MVAGYNEYRTGCIELNEDEDYLFVVSINKEKECHRHIFEHKPKKGKKGKYLKDWE